MPDNFRQLAIYPESLMTGFNYTAMRDNTAIPLINQFGDDAVLTLTPAADPATPWNPGSGTPVETPARAVQTQFTNADRDGTLIQEGDVLFIVSTQGLTDIELAETLTSSGTVYQIIKVMPLKPGPIIMLYKVHCRK